jgi:hypothetical protein
MGQPLRRVLKRQNIYQVSRRAHRFRLPFWGPVTLLVNKLVGVSVQRNGGERGIRTPGTAFDRTTV